MKKVILFILFVVFSLAVVTAQKNQGKKDPVGKWKFEAPYAPEGYTSGSIVVAFAKRQYTASMAFTGSENEFAGDKVKLVNDSLFFSIYIEGEDVAVKLKMEDRTKMSGKAVYSEGDVPLTLTKDVDAEKK